MKQKLLLTIITAIIFNSFMQAQSLLPVSVYVQEYTNDWCGSPSGSLIANVNGGTPPYTYLWSNGATDSQVNFLFAGQYDVTVTDAVSATATGAGIVSYLSAPEFYVNAIEMTRQGMNNGSVTASLYPGGMVTYLPYGTYQYILMDSTFSTVETYSYSLPGAINPTYTFDSLPQGHYHIELTASFATCYTYADFNIKEMPDLYPTFATLPACNGSPTGQLTVNSHPSPPIDANTFNSNHTSNLFVTEKIVSKYKAIVYDQSSVVKGYYRTQDSAFSITGLLPGNYTMQIYAGDTGNTFDPGTHDSVLVYSTAFTIADDTLCSLVKGRVFADYNNDCIYNSGDIKLGGTLVELNPGGYSYVTNTNGEFYIPVPVGVYTLKQYAPYQYAQLCPDTTTFTVNVTTTGLIIDVQVADSITATPDVQLGLSAGSARPGFNFYYHLYYRNLTPHNIAAQTITLNFDSNLTYVSTSLPYATLSNSQVTWTTPALGPFGHSDFNLVMNVPASAVLGTILSADATVSAVTGEVNLANNSDGVSSTVTGSFDPNDKAVDPKGFEAPGYIANFQDLKYTIRFQNTGTDTAFNITVTDTLPLTLNKYSLSVLNASHDYWHEFKNPNVVLFHFDNILLPDSNVNEEASHGLIKFSIQQMPGNSPATLIQNNAAIYFDFNTPVITNMVGNTIFDCAQMATVNYSTTSICEGDSITAAPTLLFDMNTEWYLDGSLYATDSTVNFTGLGAGIHTIDFIANNNVCDQQITNGLTVNALPPLPLLSVFSDSLVSSSVSGNQWYLDGSAISGATGDHYLALVNGWYMTIVTDVNGCSSASDSVFVLVENMSDLQHTAGVKIIPNPSPDQFEITGLPLTPATITITDAIGNVFYRGETSQSSVHINTLWLLPRGIYFVRIAEGKNKTVLKFVRN